MWEAIIGWLKNLFGGKGTTQLGKGNQAVSGSSTGDNSPVVTVAVAGDAHFNPPAPVAPHDSSSPFAELERVMPDLLNEIRNDLAEHPLVRDIVVLNTKSQGYNYRGDYLRFTADEHPEIWGKIRVLENHGLVTELRPRFAYRMTEKLVTYLRACPKWG